MLIGVALVLVSPDKSFPFRLKLKKICGCMNYCSGKNEIGEVFRIRKGHLPFSSFWFLIDF